MEHITIIPVVNANLTPVKTLNRYLFWEIRGGTHAGKRGTRIDIFRLLGYIPDEDTGHASLFQTGQVITLD